MKIVLILIAVLMAAGGATLFVLGLMSQSGQAKGLAEGRLTQCPDKPNCVSSEFEADTTHYVEPMMFTQTIEAEILSRLKNAIREMGGSIQLETDNYLAATFTSSFFKFVDDLEIRIDFDQNLIHMRSASRVGHKDRGVNKKRIEQLRILI
jgi:uncharacterized protein (DUF1499 family)